MVVWYDFAHIPVRTFKYKYGWREVEVVDFSTPYRGSVAVLVGRCDVVLEMERMDAKKEFKNLGTVL